MCRYFVSHTLRCDVRPIISSGRAKIVDSYAQPRSCRCALAIEIEHRLRCAYHDCCTMTKILYPCAHQSSCRDVVMIHNYTQVRYETRSESSETEATTATHLDAAWPELPVLDGRWPSGDDQVPRTRPSSPHTPAFWGALQVMRHAGREIDGLETTIDRWLGDIGSLEVRCIEGDDCDGCDECQCSVRHSLQEAIMGCLSKQFKLMKEFAAAREQFRREVSRELDSDWAEKHTGRKKSRRVHGI